MVCAERTLERTKGTSANSAGAGIAIYAWDTSTFCVAAVDVTGDKTFQIDVKKQGEIQLHPFAFGREQSLDFFFHTLTPILRTQCRC